MELREDARVARLRALREHLAAGRIRQDRAAVGATHDDTVPHRPDDRVELRRPGVLGFGKPTQAALHLLALTNVAGDRDGRRRLPGEVDPLKKDLGRDRGGSLAKEMDGYRRASERPSRTERIDP